MNLVISTVTAVHPAAVVPPAATATLDSDEAAEQPELQANHDQGIKESLLYVFHGRFAGFELFTYSTTPTVPPVGSVIRAKRLP